MEGRRAKGQSGFTLVELMIVVAVLAILAAVAIASYRRYILRARIVEAYTMLGLIGERQAAYRGFFDQYCDVSSASHDGTAPTLTSRWPSTSPGASSADWYTGLPAEWNQLGVRPTGRVYFQYDTVAGNAGVAPPFGGGLNYSSAPNQDVWWAAHAYGDLDGDGTQSTFEAFSMSNGVWVSGDESE
jgi:prepilin-type N-terminal cleavage/methylation domain-containing protein